MLPVLGKSSAQPSKTIDETIAEQSYRKANLSDALGSNSAEPRQNSRRKYPDNPNHNRKQRQYSEKDGEKFSHAREVA
jgi:hypothetical protein